MTTQQVVLSTPERSRTLNLGSTSLVHRIASEQTGGALAVVEFLAEPGQGVGPHVHEHEEELVYVLEGSLRVSVGDQRVDVGAGACALLPRGLPHGFTNIGSTPSRLLAVLLPGALDDFFVGLDAEFSREGEHEKAISALCRRFGVRFIDSD